MSRINGSVFRARVTMVYLLMIRVVATSSGFGSSLLPSRISRPVTPFKTMVPIVSPVVPKVSLSSFEAHLPLISMRTIRVVLLSSDRVMLISLKIP